MSRPVNVRHVVDGASTDAGAVAVLGRYFVPQDQRGVNGRNGFQEGTNTRKLREESDCSLTFPNDAGGDSVQHLERFLILTRRNAVGPDYKIGDEWLEVYEGDVPGGDLIACVTPIDYNLSPSSIELPGQDALKTLAHVRETSGGVYWVAAPRDVFEHYTQAWQLWLPEDFPQDARFGTYSGASTATSDGRWNYAWARPASSVFGSQIELAPNGSSAFVIAQNAVYLPMGPGSSEPHTHHRVEVVVTLPGMAPGDQLLFDLGGISGGPGMVLNGDGTVQISGGATINAKVARLDAQHTLGIEVRGRWMFFYMDGSLLGVYPSAAWAGPGAPRLFFSAAAGKVCRVASIACHRTRPYLMRGSDRGDYRLPGAPPPGGLLGSYFSEAANALAAAAGGEGYLSPLLKPYARRVDSAVNFAAPGALPNAWQPAGTANGEKFSVRWTGAIYLDDPSTWLLRVTATDRVRVWVGKTRFGEQLIDDWAGGHAGMTTTTAGATLAALGAAAGWYPIVIEYVEETGVGGCILEAQKSGGAWVVPGSTTAGAPQLSPLGIFEDHVRAESHYTMVKQIADTFGFQYVCKPMALESGEFPGRLVPRVREGTDYDLTTTEDDSTSLQVHGSAEDSVDVLVADAQGIADPTSNAQLSAEIINFAEAGQHLIVHAEAESLSDIASPELLQQRLTSLLSLRSSPFEQVSAVVATAEGERVLVPIPLTGVPAEIAWEPGDGIKRYYPSVGVIDSSQVQMTAIARKLTPDAHGLPGVSFRPRPRNFRDFLVRMQQAIVAPQRNYQGQTGPLPGTLGSNQAAVTPDSFSRVALPADLDDVATARLFVMTKSDASAWNLEVNGVVRINGVTAADPAGFDVKPWLARAVATEPLMHARLVSAGAGSTGTWQVVLVLTVRI